MSTADSRKAAEGFVASWNDHDVEKTVAFIAEGGTWQEVSMPEPMPDRAAMRGFIQGWFTAFPDLTARVVRSIASDDEVAVELEFRGNNTGPMQFNRAAPAMPPTGRAVEGKGTFFARVKDGKFVELHTYPDMIGLMVQLGMMPAPRG